MVHRVYMFAQSPRSLAISGATFPAGRVNYEYWLPVPGLMNPQIQSFIATYQSRAEKAGADPLGYYVAPQAYAQLQVLEQAVKAVGSLDDAALSEYTRTATFET